MIPEWRQTDRIRCLECGRWYRALPTHLRRGHAMTEDDYREAHNIPAGLPLVCLDWSDAQSRRNRDRGASRTLSTAGPEPGYRQRDYVLRQRRAQYLDLAAQGAQAARQVDRTADRRAALAPYSHRRRGGRAAEMLPPDGLPFPGRVCRPRPAPPDRPRTLRHPG